MYLLSSPLFCDDWQILQNKVFSVGITLSFSRYQALWPFWFLHLFSWQITVDINELFTLDYFEMNWTVKGSTHVHWSLSIKLSPLPEAMVYFHKLLPTRYLYDRRGCLSPSTFRQPLAISDYIWMLWKGSRWGPCVQHFKLRQASFGPGYRNARKFAVWSTAGNLDNSPTSPDFLAYSSKSQVGYLPYGSYKSWIYKK